MLRYRMKILSVLAVALLLTSLSHAQQPTSASSTRAEALTNADVLKMVEAKLSDDLIISKIRASAGNFDTSTDTILKLKSQGVSDAIIQAMVAAGKPLAQASTPSAVSAVASNPPVVTRAQNPAAHEGMNWNDFKAALMKRYDQKVVVTRVAGLQAGEKKSSFGAGQAGMHWHHFQTGMQVPEKVTSGLLFVNKLSDMQRLDDYTFGKLIQGVNTTGIDKNERLKVSKFYIYSDFIEFVLAATEMGHMRDIDVAKANTEQYGNTRVFHDFGLVFRFHFDKESVLKAGDYQMVIAEIGKYLLPQDEAEAAIAAEKNIELEIGMPETAVIEKLGQPLRTVKVGDQKILKFKEMTVIIKDGKVAEVKVE